MNLGEYHSSGLALPSSDCLKRRQSQDAGLRHMNDIHPDSSCR
ncbi:MAG: hypothetical protein K0S04_3158 [Herbinix sp.]|jgi:hypothetical protein|nr:hypothetical protein [Herbinix sp.]